jgi:hypothetical protein
MLDPYLLSVASKLSAGLSYGQVDMDIFQLNLDREWRTRMASILDLFQESPTHLIDAYLQEEDELYQLEQRFAQSESWEWCACLRDKRAKLTADRLALERAT